MAFPLLPLALSAAGIYLLSKRSPPKANPLGKTGGTIPKQTPTSGGQTNSASGKQAPVLVTPKEAGPTVQAKPPPGMLIPKDAGTPATGIKPVSATPGQTITAVPSTAAPKPYVSPFTGKTYSNSTAARSDASLQGEFANSLALIAGVLKAYGQDASSKASADWARAIDLDSISVRNAQTLEAALIKAGLTKSPTAKAAAVQQLAAVPVKMAPATMTLVAQAFAPTTQHVPVAIGGMVPSSTAVAGTIPTPKVATTSLAAGVKLTK